MKLGAVLQELRTRCLGTPQAQRLCRENRQAREDINHKGFVLVERDWRVMGIDNGLRVAFADGHDDELGISRMLIVVVSLSEDAPHNLGAFHNRDAVAHIGISIPGRDKDGPM